MTVAGEPFDRLDLGPFGLHAQHQATVDRHAVQEHRAGATVAVVAAFLRSGQPQRVAKHLQQALPGLAQELDGLAVDRRGDVDLLGHGRVSSSGEWRVASCERRQTIAFMGLRSTITRHPPLATRHCSSDGPGQRAPGQHAHQVHAKLGGAAHVADRPAASRPARRPGRTSLPWPACRRASGSPRPRTAAWGRRRPGHAGLLDGSPVGVSAPTTRRRRRRCPSRCAG